MPRGASQGGTSGGQTEDDETPRHARVRRIAAVGAFAVGLGFTNQHTIIFFSAPVVLFVLGAPLLSGRGPSLLAPPTLLLLAGAFAAGLVPYWYLVYSANHAPLGTWGDQRSWKVLLKP